MADPQTSEAYYLLDRVFQSAPSLNTAKSLSQGQIPSKTISKPVTTFELSSLPKKNGLYFDNTLPSSPLIPPFAIDGHNTGLPPTPPSHSNDRGPKVTFSPTMRAQNGTSLLDHRSSAASTPLNARSPPTPDTTPPASLGVPPRDNPSRMSSTRAESFSTAREEQWSSDEEERGVRNGNTRDTVPRDTGTTMSFPGDRNRGLDIQEDESDTPTQETPSPKTRRVFAKSKRASAGSLNQIPNREWDTNLMRHVTVRRKKPRPLTSPGNHDDESRVKEREIVPKLVTGSSEEEDLGPTTPHLAEFGQAIGWPKATDRTRIRDDDSKRLSDMSSTSTTIVEAIVTASPPRRQRTLRHVSRNLSLRSDAGSSIDGSPSPRSTRTSLFSEEIPSRRLAHKRASVSSSSPRGSGNSEMLMNGHSLPITMLKHHPERASLRADAYKSGHSEELLESSPSLSAYKQRRASAGQVAKTGTISDGTKYRMSSLPAHSTKTQSPSKAQFDDSFQYSMRRIGSDKKRESHPTRLATQRALRQVDGLAALPEPKIRRSSIDEQIQAKERSPTNLDTLDAFPSPGKSSLKQTILPTSEHSRSRPSIEASTSGSVRRVSFDRSTIGTYELARSSIDHSHLRPDEYAGRPLLTPFSETSDHQLEISEATAVNLYPHNNNSLLVVQQLARPAEVQSNGSDALNIPGWPALTVQPATPPTLSAEVINVDSPLRHPRKPPHPPVQAPVIRILPATPNEELETSPLDGAEIRPGLPKRSLSFKEHAIQFSETLMQPIFPKSNSIKRRSAYKQKRRSEPQQKANTLHPFWQPRGFWDDFSDSDSEFEESAERDDRLPPGGDTSDVVLPRSIATRVLDGFRGSGGFLIGNSLGVERAGSNKRRHYVPLPVGLGKRTSSHVLRSTSEGTLRSLKSLESLSRKSQGKVKRWNPKNWRVHYVGVGGMRDMWKEKQASKRRQKLRDSIGVRYMVEGAPVL